MRSASPEPGATPIAGDITSDESPREAVAAAPQRWRGRSEAFEAQKRYMEERFGRGRQPARKSPA